MRLIPLSTPQGVEVLLFSSWGIKLRLGKYSKTRRPLLVPEEQTDVAHSEQIKTI